MILPFIFFYMSDIDFKDCPINKGYAYGNDPKTNTHWCVKLKPLTPPKSTSSLNLKYGSFANAIGQAAFISYFCGLRSRYWAENIRVGVENAIEDDPEYTKLSHGQKDQFLNWFFEEQKRSGYRMEQSVSNSCKNLLNSPLVARLDALEYRLTNAYH